MISDKDLMIKNVKKELQSGSFDKARIYIQNYLVRNKLDKDTIESLQTFATHNDFGDEMFAFSLSLEDRRPAAPPKAPLPTRFQQAEEDYALAATLRFIEEEKAKEEKQRIANQKREDEATLRFLREEGAKAKATRLNEEKINEEKVRILEEKEKRERTARLAEIARKDELIAIAAAENQRNQRPVANIDTDADFAAAVNIDLNDRPVVDIDADAAYARAEQEREARANAALRDVAARLAANMPAIPVAAIDGLTPEQRDFIAGGGDVIAERKAAAEAEHRRVRGDFAASPFKGIKITDDGLKIINEALASVLANKDKDKAKNQELLGLLKLREPKEITYICQQDPLTQDIILDPVAMYSTKSNQYEFFERATAEKQIYDAALGGVPKSYTTRDSLENGYIDAQTPEDKDARHDDMRKAKHAAAIEQIKKIRANLEILRAKYDNKPAARPAARRP